MSVLGRLVLASGGDRMLMVYSLNGTLLSGPTRVRSLGPLSRRSLSPLSLSGLSAASRLSLGGLSAVSRRYHFGGLSAVSPRTLTSAACARGAELLPIEKGLAALRQVETRKVVGVAVIPPRASTRGATCLFLFARRNRLEEHCP